LNHQIEMAESSSTLSGKSAALVLGSGGARGLAHIGVISHLRSLGVRIEYISGCSMGALVGGIYAAGELDAYEEWARKLERKDVIGLLDLSFGFQGLFKGERVIGALREITGEHRIEDLDVGFTAVATDLLEQREIWLNKGPLFDAIRASMAIPTIFTPWEYEGRVLVDGGLLNPLPIAPALNHATDLIIVVNASGRRSRRLGPREAELVVPGIFDAMAMTMDTMQNAIARLKLAAYSPDVMIEIPRDACSFYEFYRAAELIELGADAAASSLASLSASP
jgi:NTE family protein